MKDLILNNLGIGFFIFCLIMIVFLFSDLKINNIYLANELDEANIQLEEKDILLKSYAGLIDSLLISEKISVSELSGILPEQEVRKFRLKNTD